MKVEKYQSHLFDQLVDSTGNLAIFCSASECIFAIKSSTDVLVFYHQYLNEDKQEELTFIRDVFARNQHILSKDYQSVSIGLQSSEFSLFPDAVTMNTTEAMAILLGKDNPNLASDSLPLIKSKISFELPAEIEYLFNQNLQQYSLYHCAKYGVSQLLSTDLDAFIVCEQTHFSLFIQANNELQLANRYAKENAEDLLYFTLLGLQDSSIAPEKATIGVVNAKSGDSCIELLRDYIGRVNIEQFNHQLTLQPDFPSNSSNFYILNLLNESN